MKKFKLLAFMLLIMASISNGCIEEGEPDLYWLDYQTVYNPCTGQNEYLNVSRFFWVYNLNNPNYPPQVLLYYNDQLDIFSDCLGYPWYIIPGSELTSYRYMTNQTVGSTAKSPSARAFVTVRDNNGGTQEIAGDVITFNDLSPGQTVTLNTTIKIMQDNSKYLTEYSADPENAIAESDESNNTSSDGFSRSPSPAPVSFEIKVPSELELAKIKTRYILYRNGEIEIRN